MQKKRFVIINNDVLLNDLIEEQISIVFQKNFNILSNDNFIEIIKSKKIPKKKSVLLTLDDGFKDHYKYVYPHLQKKKLFANFYAPVLTIKNSKVLDVHKIHFILENHQLLLDILQLDDLFHLPFRLLQSFHLSSHQWHPFFLQPTCEI